ncbi:MAG: class I SAM-dependent methyltransferase [Dehalococcoidia bacterium]
MLLVRLGTVVVTPAAAAAIAEAGEDAQRFLRRYERGDWSDDTARRRRDADFAAEHDLQIFALYRLRNGGHVLITSAADRSSTNVLLPAEYQRREVSVGAGYAAWAEIYDSEKNALIALEQPLVDKLLANLRFTTVLDVGAGTGRHALRLARRGARVIAVDESMEMLSRGRTAGRAEGLPVDFCLASLEQGLPFASERFDLVVCALVLCHVPRLDEGVREFHRVLRPGGHLLITDFHPDAVAYGWRTAFHHDGAFYTLPNVPHSRTDYLQATESAGFHLSSVLDLPLHAAPDGYIPEDLLRENGEMNFCLMLLDQKR